MRQLMRASQTVWRAPTQQSFRQKFVQDFVQGAVEDEVKDRMGRPNLQTGAPSAGGTAAGILRQAVKTLMADNKPFTPRQHVAQLQAVGLTVEQAVAIIEQNATKLHSSTLQTMLTHQLMSYPDGRIVMRERAVGELPEGEIATAVQKVEQARADQAKAEELANLSVAEILTAPPDGAGGGEASQAASE